ncbi:MAG: D-alanyl-D-alanine carboxypeptidase [Christensenellaceae bacterium]|jgi:D-alanyl-D-alanine carboxypeptidase (penicillin-binding protein 5/6)|nr:D-alanyl-D-alanine carboxypeptidase [Christensenellaceae bacterium]
MTKKLILFSILTLALFLGVLGLNLGFNNTAAGWSETPTAWSSAKSMVVLSADDGKMLYSKNENEKLAMASTTKIATCITVIENCDNLDKLVDTPKEATLTEGTSIYLKETEKLSIRQLLYGLMLQSGNDAAVALAISVGGSVEGFASLMNDMAKRAGAENTHFVNPHGLDHKDHYTTALDLGKITAQALKNKDFAEIVSTKKYKIEKTEHNNERYLGNKNKLLNSLEGCVGVKTGFTSKAGRCLVSACKRGDMTVVCVVLNCGPMFEESATLLGQSFEEYTYVNILDDHTIVGEVMVENGEKSAAKVYNKEGFGAVLKKEDAENINVEYDFEKTLEAPIKKDQIVGEYKVFVNKDLQFCSKLYIMEEVDNLDITDKLKNIIEKWN